MKEANVTFWETLRMQKSRTFYYTWPLAQHHSDAACGTEGLDSMLHNSEALAKEPQAQVGLEATELPTLTKAQLGSANDYFSRS